MDRNNEKHKVRIIFAEGPTFADTYFRHSKAIRRRIIRSYPHLIFWLFGAWLIRFCTHSRTSHILLSDGEVVLDYQFSQTKFWSYIQFTQRYQSVLGYIDIYSDVPPMLERWEGRSKPDAWWRCLWTLIRYLTGFFTFGLLSGQNCVTIARQICAEANIKVPRHYHSPALFRRWLLEHGTDFTARTPPTHS